MAKFLGVISAQYKNPSDDFVLEYSDLNLLADYLLNETQNLLCDFQRQYEVINQREIELNQNLTKIKEIRELQNLIHVKTWEIEQEFEQTCICINIIEGIVDYLESFASNCPLCESKYIVRRNIGEQLVKISKDQMRMNECLEQLKDGTDETLFNAHNGVTKNFLLFLDYYTRILENIELKSDKITDQLKEIDGLFQNAYQKSIGAGYHKINHDISSSYC